MNGFDALLRFLATHLVQTAFAVFILGSIVRAIVQAAREDPARRRPAGALRTRTPEAELRDRVRRGFEEMMRRRAAAQTPAAPPRGPERARTAPSPRSPAPRTPAPTPSIPASAPATSPTPAAAREKLARRQAPVAFQSAARRMLRDRASLRRALLTREILDAPLSLREPR